MTDTPALIFCISMNDCDPQLGLNFMFLGYGPTRVKSLVAAQNLLNAWPLITKRHVGGQIVQMICATSEIQDNP